MKGKNLCRLEAQKEERAQRKNQAHEGKHTFCFNQSATAFWKGKPATDKVQH